MYRFADLRLPMIKAETALIQGFNRNVDQNWRQAAEGAEAGEFFNLPTAAVDCDVSSESATANQSVLIIGYDGTNTQIQEVAVLNGQTRVQLTNQFFRIKVIIVISNTQTTEPFMDNSGDHMWVYDRTATVTTGKPDSYFGIVDIGKSISKQGYWYIPPLRTSAFVSAIVNINAANNRDIRMIVQWRNTNDKVWKTIVETAWKNNNSFFSLDSTPILYDATYGIDVRINCQAITTARIHGALFALHLLEEDP